MALTVTKTKLSEGREGKRYSLSLTFDNSYPTGGESLDVSDVMTFLDYCVVQDGSGYVPAFTTFSGATCKVEMWEGDYAQAGDEPLTEVDAASDLSTVTIVVVAVGRDR